MKDRVLFWIDVEFMFFGIAHQMKKKYDFDAYAIVDVNERAKKFFKEQNVVNFEKIWFYIDQVEMGKKEPDWEYLKKFEKKYGISIEGLAYTERSFYKFNKYYKFSWEEILSIIEQECKAYEKILEEINPNFLIMKMSDLHQNHLVYEMCKSRDIKTIMLFPTRLGYKIRLGEFVNKFDYPYEVESKDNISFSELHQYIQKHSAYKQVNEYQKNYLSFNSQKLISTIKFFLDIFNNDYQKRFTNYKRTRLKILYNQIALSLKKQSRKNFLDNNAVLKIPNSEKFVYFPLHVEPERTLYIDAPFYTNQIEVISNIAKSLPVEYTLYVKEHPVMKVNGWRPSSYYKQIMRLPNVKLIHPSINPEELYKKCSLVVTVTGSAGLEALFYEKPVITLSKLIYSDISSVHLIKNLEDFPIIIRNALASKVNPNEVYNFIKQLEQDSFEFDWNHLRTDFSSRFYYGGYLTNFEMDNAKMKMFLDEYKQIFETLSEQYIKKIIQHKQKLEIVKDR